ncbi:hypothetical protein PB1_10629 [Bacillus methanolicus PB1]|uniref:General stress protein n=1 Tax=Bacillus methanolicus PB1 TaxID=997296 RepID=I3DUU5_BACMT|nr:hypothetical protein [Bacillus methanolicus]EIJ78016.1 hypothetical protein PB1_10629 [Bacillus methanolicus PB1]
MKINVKRKLLSLFTGELFAAVSFALLWIMYIQLFDWTEPYLTSFPSLYAFVLLEFILLQGSFYWFLKFRQVQRECYSHLPYRQLRLFVFFKRFNLFLIAIGLLLMIYQYKINAVDFYWFLFLYVFAIIEYINYYHIRLSYQSIDEIKDLIRQRGLRSSKLARELKNL